ncbi:hypothetical protein ACFO1B_28750 [Dactylosporangium siamense]|uniref:Uncharacterized protein n=1 Tax=Dactylosporangium siamense TaxID=685454 RepID=A0A919UFX4_9ACTN|nr:hypothetical protein [Dactylosporangium siamense]GIG50651.1 hypothetical protein Dsi01nite_086920 [Dactylosporangium siamense]
MAYAYPPQPAYAMRTTAPVSLHVVAIFQYLGGLVTLGIGALFGLAAFDVVPRWQSALDSASLGRSVDVTPIIVAIGAVFVVVGLIAIVLGRKVQRGRNWARVVLIILNTLSLVSVVWQVYQTSLLTMSTIVSAALPVLFLVLLNTRAARAWCRYGTY